MEFFKVTYLGKDEEVEGLLNRLRDLTKAEQAMVMALTLSSAKNIEKAVDSVSNFLSESNRAMTVKERRKFLQDTLESDASGKIATTNAELNEKRTKETGD